MEKQKYTGVQKLQDNRFLNMYHLDAVTYSGEPFDYYFVSRNKEEKLKINTHRQDAEGMVIYPVWKEDPEKLVMIRQYRYPVGDYIYELPAGLIDAGENAMQAAVREMKEETGFDFEVYNGGREMYRRAFFLAPGFSDEAGQAVFGYAFGEITKKFQEDSEYIEVLLVDKKEAERILSEERVSIRCAYLLMQFLHMEKESPFAFLD